MILLSNLLDNAIRESEKVLKNTGKAVIHLKLECEDHKLIFAVRNPVTEKVEIENDTIKSKRGDHHGIGLLNVKAVIAELVAFEIDIPMNSPHIFYLLCIYFNLYIYLSIYHIHSLKFS